MKDTIRCLLPFLKRKYGASDLKKSMISILSDMGLISCAITQINTENEINTLSYILVSTLGERVSIFVNSHVLAIAVEKSFSFFVLKENVADSCPLL